MSGRKAVWIVGGLAIACFLAAIIGGAMGGSHRWVEVVEGIGWILFVLVIAMEYLIAQDYPDDSSQSRTVNAAWMLGLIAIALFISSILANALSVDPKQWMEALEVAGLFCLAGMVILAVSARRRAPG